MKCRICGAKLAKKGDLCTKCYNELQEEMKFNEDKKVLFTLKPMYSLKRCFKRIAWYLVIAIASIMYSINIAVTEGGFGNILVSVIGSIGLLLLFVCYFAYRKYYATNNKMVFYETRVKKITKYPLMEKTVKNIKYDDIEDIVYYSAGSIDKKKVGQIIIYARKTGYFGGIRISEIEDIEGKFEKLRSILPVEFE